MKVTLLGTGTSQGVPVIACDCIVCLSEDSRDKRLRSSIMLEIGETNIVIDSGPDFRQQMLNHSVKKIDAIIFTHEHKDHVAGLDDVRAFNNSSNKETQVYASQRVKEALHREFHYVFSENKYPGIPRININEIKNEKFYINDIEIIPIEVLHHKLPVFGFRINKFVYITDVSFISEKEKEKIFGAEVLVIDSLRKKKHPVGSLSVHVFFRKLSCKISRFHFTPHSSFHAGGDTGGDTVHQL